jgi:hypothetical protein
MAVTNFEDANVATFSLTSGGAAYDITIPFEADTIEWFNYTKFATNSNNLQGIWFNGMPAGDALIIARGTTDLTSTLETTNGVTELSDGSGFSSTIKTPTAITQASPAVVTSAGHGLSNGQFVRATNFRATPVADATFALFYPYSNIPVDTTAETAFVNNGVAKFNLVGESLYTQNAPPTYQYTLGTAIMGADGDVIYIRAMKANQVTALGDVGA